MTLCYDQIMPLFHGVNEVKNISWTLSSWGELKKEICVDRCPQKYNIRWAKGHSRVNGLHKKAFGDFLWCTALLFTFSVLNAPFLKPECPLIHFWVMLIIDQLHWSLESSGCGILLHGTNTRNTLQSKSICKTLKNRNLITKSVTTTVATMAIFSLAKVSPLLFCAAHSSNPMSS